MKKKYLLHFLLITFSVFLVGCGTNEVKENTTLESAESTAAVEEPVLTEEPTTEPTEEPIAFTEQDLIDFAVNAGLDLKDESDTSALEFLCEIEEYLPEIKKMTSSNYSYDDKSYDVECVKKFFGIALQSSGTDWEKIGKSGYKLLLSACNGEKTDVKKGYYKKIMNLLGKLNFYKKIHKKVYSDKNCVVYVEKILTMQIYLKVKNKSKYELSFETIYWSNGKETMNMDGYTDTVYQGQEKDIKLERYDNSGEGTGYDLTNKISGLFEYTLFDDDGWGAGGKKFKVKKTKI